MNTSKTTIKCPHCGCEYLAAEIFYPQEFFGNPNHILRSDKGAIVGFQGDDLNLEEQYTCDKCGKTFSVTANITFKTEQVEDIFSDEDDFDVEEAK